MEEQKKKNPLLRALAFLLTVIVVLSAVFLVANWQKLNFDAIKRHFAYRSLIRSETGQTESYTYSGGPESQFACLDDDLLVCSTNGIRLYSPSGTAYIDQPCLLEHPVISVGGSSALVYDAGGSQLFVYSNREQIFSFVPTQGHAILSASLNPQGLLTVVTQASGVKGAVTVYDSKFQPILSVNLSSRFVYDAVLSPDGKTLALATSGQSGGVYNSHIDFYDLNRPSGGNQPDASAVLGSSAILKLDWHESLLRAMGEKDLYFMDSNGELKAAYNFGDRYLKGFSLDGDHFSVLLLGKYRAGSSAELVTIDPSGQVLASANMDQQVLSLSSSGRYFCILTADGLTIYTEDLTPYYRLEGNQEARKVLQRSDGSVMLISGEKARLHLPD